MTSWETGRMGGGASKNRPVSAAPKTNTDVAKKLGKAFDDGGIKKVILIRHANAKPRDPDAAAVEAGTVLKADTPHANAWTVGDLTRGITEKGEQQAKASKAAYLDGLSLKAVICSEAERAIATKNLMTDGHFPPGGAGVLTLHTLHPSRSGTPDCEKMFDKLGYGPLSRYYEDSTVENLEGKGKPTFRHYVTKVTGELNELIKTGQASFPPSGDTVAVFGHAVFLNAVAVAVAEAMGVEQADDKVSVIELGEAEGILCDGAAKTVTLLTA